MGELIALLILSATVEGTITYIRELPKEWHWSYIGALGLGMVLAFGYNMDLPYILGRLIDVDVQSTIPYLGQVLGGVAIARGSNYIFDIIGWVSVLPSQIKYSVEPKITSDIQDE